MITRIVVAALLGALIGAAPWVIAFAGKSPTGTDRTWALMFALIFALVGATVGVISAILFSGAGRATTAAAKYMERRPTSADPANIAEWENPRNWSAGLFYHSRADSRILVPKRLGGFGYTVNLGHPAGKIILGILLIAALIVLVLGLRKRS